MVLFSMHPFKNPLVYSDLDGGNSCVNMFSAFSYMLIPCKSCKAAGIGRVLV